MEEDEGMQWFRWWHDATTDGKLLRLSLEHRWLWIALLTLASESPKRGSLYVSENLPCDIEDVARKANLDQNTCQAGIELMMRPRFNMVGIDENNAWCIVNWSKRQPKREDATNAERQKRYRNAHSNAPSNAPDTESDTETETDKNTYTPTFERFWTRYPRKVNKKGAFKAWKATLNKKADVEDVITSAENYAARCKRIGTEEQFILHASTFLGPQERWKEYLTGEPTVERKTIGGFTPSDGFTFTDEPH